MTAEPRCKQIGSRLSNWGRWGEDDSLGTMNFITAETRRAAASLVRTGALFDLGIPLDRQGPQRASGMLNSARFNPIHRMTQLPTEEKWPEGEVESDDIVILPLQCATQWDGLAHIGYDKQLYNGVPTSAVTAAAGAERNSFHSLAASPVGRGVLLDIPSSKGVGHLQGGEEITADDLDAASSRQGVDIRSGDILLVRTGWFQHFANGDVDTYMGRETPGLGVSCCEWLHDKEVAAVASDTHRFEVGPSKELPVLHPVHMILIRDLGMTLGEIFNLEELARDCQADGRWEFFFSGAGLKVTGAVGSPLTPIAMK